MVSKLQSKTTTSIKPQTTSTS